MCRMFFFAAPEATMGYITPEALTGQISCHSILYHHVCLSVEDVNQSMVFDRLLASSLATCPLLTSCSFLTFRTVLLPFPRHALLRYRSLQVTASGRTFEIKTLFKDSWKSFWSGIDSALSRFHWLAGFRSSATALTARFQQDMMQISTSALLATWDGTHLSFPEMTLRPRPGD